MAGTPVAAMAARLDALRTRACPDAMIRRASFASPAGFVGCSLLFLPECALRRASQRTTVIRILCDAQRQ